MRVSGSRRLLLPLTYGFSVRYSLPTGLAQELAQRFDLVVGLGWDDQELRAELEALGAEVVELTQPELSHSYRMFRRRMGSLRDRRLQSPTTPIRVARQRAALHGRRALAIDLARRARDRAVITRPGGASAAEAAEPSQVESGTNVAMFRSFLDAHAIEAVLSLTPYHDPDALLLWAARSTGRPTLTSMISFDNPTTRERLLVRSEQLFVWNRFNQDELLRSYPELSREQVRIIGAPQFDLHQRPDLVMKREAWSEQLGVSPDRPVILYGAGPSQMIPHEHRLVELIDEAISDGRIPGRPHLLVRRHPVDPAGSWSDISTRLRNGSVVDPWVEGPGAFRSWPTVDDIVMQMSTLAHAEVHVNMCSSMTLDGACFDRPQIAPTFIPLIDRAEARRVRAFYRQEHWQPIRRSGGVVEAPDGRTLVRAIASALLRPEERRSERERMVQDVLTFTDGLSTNRLVAATVSALQGDPAG